MTFLVDDSLKLYHFFRMGGITIASDDEGEGEDETEYIQFMEKVKEDEMLCLDVGGERHFVKRGLLIRQINYFSCFIFSTILTYKTSFSFV